MYDVNPITRVYGTAHSLPLHLTQNRLIDIAGASPHCDQGRPPRCCIVRVGPVPLQADQELRTHDGLSFVIELPVCSRIFI